MSAAIAPNPNDPQAPLGMPARPWWIGYIRQLHLDIPLAVESGGTGKNTPLDASDIAETSALKILTADERTKLAGIAEGAEVNTVYSVAGRTGDVTLDADDVATTSTKLWMSDTQSAKLAGIAEAANNYTHPASHPQSMIEGLADALAAKAPLASPALTGTPTAPTAEKGTNTTQIATTAYVWGNYKQTCSYTQGGSSTVNPAEPGKLYSFTGAGTLVLPVASTVPDGTIIDVFCQAASATVTIQSTSSILSNAGLTNTLSLAGYGASIRIQSIFAGGSAYYWMVLFDPARLIDRAKISPALTGTPTAPTAAEGTNTTQLATTAFVQAKAAGALLTEGTPSGPTATGTKGMARFDADYFYVCTATNTWVRFAKDGSWT